MAPIPSNKLSHFWILKIKFLQSSSTGIMYTFYRIGPQICIVNNAGRQTDSFQVSNNTIRILDPTIQSAITQYTILMLSKSIDLVRPLSVSGTYACFSSRISIAEWSFKKCSWKNVSEVSEVFLPFCSKPNKYIVSIRLNLHSGQYFQ